MEKLEDSRPSSKRTIKFVVGGLVIALTIFGLIGWSMTRPGSTAFYMTPTELVAAPPAEDIRVNGDVIKESIERDGVVTTFDVTDGETTLTITTDRPLPDAFYSDDGVEVVAEGAYSAGVFEASQVLAKCPSKFKAKA